MNNSLPHWSLENIYKSVESEDFLSDLDKVETLSKRLKDVPSLELYDELSALMITLDAYTSALLSTDSSDESYLKARSKVDEKELIYKSAEDFFIRYIGRTEEKAGDLLFVKELRSESKHLMSVEEEALAAELSISGDKAWSNLQQTLSSSIKDGEKTLTELRSLAFNCDRAIRKEAFEKEVALLERHRNSFAAALSGVKGTVLTLERKRGWKTPIERSIFSSRITEKTLECLFTAIKAALPMFQDYLKIKGGLLNIEDFSFYDRFAPLGRSREYSFECAKKIVLESYASFDENMAAFAEHAFDSGWIDAEPREGKTGGAYSVYFPLSHESRVFMNFDSSYDSVLTLAHELGHAYHDSILCNNPTSRAIYPMTLAETASLFGELLVTENLLSKTSDKADELFILDQFLTSSSETIMDIYSRYLFESDYFERRREGDVSADECVSLMLDAEKRAYGDSLTVYHPYMWAVKSHYYDAGFSFYNYPYAFGLLFALSLYSMKGEKDFPSIYRDILGKTGEMDVKTLLASIGLDAESEAFWMNGVKMIEHFVERMKQCL